MLFTDAYDTAVCGNASTNSSAFKDAATRLVANLNAAALNQTEFYQVGSANVAADRSVYGMAQCWKSLNASGCRDCLENARASAVKCLPATDGKALNAGCFVRFYTECLGMKLLELVLVILVLQWRIVVHA